MNHPSNNPDSSSAVGAGAGLLGVPGGGKDTAPERLRAWGNL